MSLTEETKVSPLKTNEQALQNVVTSVANLSLVSSTRDVCATCTATKDSHPVKSDCNRPEMDIKMAATAADVRVQPLLTKPEPKITIAKEYACLRIDELEEKLLVRQRTVNKVILDTKEPLSTTGANAEGAISSTVAEVKTAVSGVTDVAPETAQGNVEATKNTVMESTVGQKGASNTSSTRRKLGPRPPVMGQEQVSTEQQGEPNSNSLHVGMLPNTVCQRFVARMKAMVQNIRDELLHLQITLDLVEYSKRSMAPKHPEIQEELNKMWLTWSIAELEGSEKDSLLKSETMESRMRLVFRYNIQRLRTGCLALRFNTLQLPGLVREQLHQLETIIDYVQSHTCAAASFQNFPDTVLELSRLKILKARILLHDFLDYVIENISLMWAGESLSSSKDLEESAKGTKETKQPSGPKSAKGTKETKQPSDPKSAKGTKETKQPSDPKSAKGMKETKLPSDPKSAKGTKGTKETKQPSGQKSK